MLASGCMSLDHFCMDEHVLPQNLWSCHRHNSLRHKRQSCTRQPAQLTGASLQGSIWCWRQGFPRQQAEQPFSRQFSSATTALGSSSSPASSAAEGSDVGASAPEHQYKYIGSGNRRHATMEDAWSLKMGGDGHPVSSMFGGENVPWGLGWQASERNLVWSDQLKMGLLKKVAAAELSLSGDEMEHRLATLQMLLPDIASRMPQMKAQLLVKLAGMTDRLADRLLELKVIFPSANVSRMVSRAPVLALMDDIDHILKAAVAFREMLPSADLDQVVEENISILDTETFTVAIEEAKRLLPNTDIGDLLNKNPGMVLQFQRGSSMIPYDAVPGQD